MYEAQIKDFQSTGNFTSSLDEFGNLQLKTESLNLSDKAFVYLPYSVVYDEDEIKSKFDVEFTEILPPVSNASLSAQSNVSAESEQSTQEQLDALLSDTSDSERQSETMAARDIIVKLRIKLGEGTSTDDFSDVFPYLKK